MANPQRVPDLHDPVGRDPLAPPTFNEPPTFTDPAVDPRYQAANTQIPEMASRSGMGVGWALAAIVVIIAAIAYFVYSGTPATTPPTAPPPPAATQPATPAPPAAAPGTTAPAAPAPATPAQ